MRVTLWSLFVPRGGTALLAAICVLALAPMTQAQNDTVLIERGTSMRYLANSTDPGLGLGWTANGFDDSSWAVGVYGIGYENNSPGALGLIDTPVPNTTRSIYTRLTVNIPDVGQVTNVFLGADFDDAYAAWINGIEVFRSSGLSGALDWDSPGGDHESSNNGVEHYEFTDVTGTALGVLISGDNEIAIAAFNSGAGSSDLVLVPNLTLNKTVTLDRGPYLQQGSNDAVTVRWRTEVPTDSRVLCGPSPGSLAPCAQDPTLVQDHEIELPGLSDDTTYYYAIGDSSRILAGDDVDHKFITAPLTGVARPTRVWILGDSGTGDQNAMDVRDAYYTAVGSGPTHLWLMLGDNAYNSGTDGEYQSKLFDIYPSMLRQSVLWPTLGNHDSITANSVTQTGPYFDTFTLPTMGEAGGVNSGTEAYYSFDYGNIHFVVLDSTDTPRTPGSMMLMWLASDLAATAQDWIIAIWHHPPYSKGSHDSDMEAPLMEMRQYVVPVLDEYGVDLTFTGHSHSYERSFPIEGHYGLSTTFDDSMLTASGGGNPAGTGPYVKPVAGPDPYSGIVHTVAGNAGKLSGGSLNHPVMYLSLNVLGSVVLDVNGTQLDVSMLDASGVVQDQFRILKGSTMGLPVAAFSVAPAVGAAPLLVDFTDLTQNAPTGWAWDFENDGMIDATSQNPMNTYAQPGLYDVRLNVVNPVGVDEVVQAAAVCVHTPAPTQVNGLIFNVWNDILFWDAPAGVNGYDVIRGNANQLRSTGGDFGNAQVVCLANDTTETTLTDAAPMLAGEAVFYLVRTADCSDRTGSFDTSGASQIGLRDLELQGPMAACACENNDDPDADGFCGAFDTCTDSDGDGFGDPGFPANVCPPDNCPLSSNPGQLDDDFDGAGNACDVCPLDPDDDLDLDGWCGDIDNCPMLANPAQFDADTDGVGDACDNCPGTINPGQLDDDLDGQGNACDGCPIDPLKIAPGDCGCGNVENDVDFDGLADCIDPCLDADGDGYGIDGGGGICLGADCDDTDPAINPGAVEFGCDGLDNDCNAGTPDLVDLDGDTYTCDVDCNDGSSAINPGMTEIGCDGLDNDCDVATLDLLDADTDTFACDVDCNDADAAINPGATEVSCDGIDNDCSAGTPDVVDADSDTYTCDIDCNDADPNINPGQSEVGCDGLDNDCSGGTPDVLDADNDTYACDIDCNDANSNINPGQSEVGCDGLDNDCSAGTPDVLDADSDTYACDVDCNDTDANINPGAMELGCDAIDNDCNAGTSDILDSDSDGFACDVDCNDLIAFINPGETEVGCDGLDNDCDFGTPDLADADTDLFTCDIDCNDNDAAINPGATEVGCDGLDNDCDGGTPDVLDADSDTYTCDLDCNDADPNINPGETEVGCDGLDNDCSAGTSDVLDADSDTYACDIDCNDADSSINPGETEIDCDGLDNDCSAGTPDIVDRDMDTFACDVDCNDADPNINPGETELGCDGLDNDCNAGTLDILDADSDSFTCDTDCNDADPAINPGAAEAGCDGIDNDCDDLTPDVLDADSDTHACDVDCDDSNAAVNPGAAELACDGLDNDCNSGTPDIVDADSDGYTCTFDCNDADPGINPGQAEISCDMLDNDCDSGTPDVFDVDGDSFACDVDCLETGILAAHTFPGAAPNDDPGACMTDRDGDDWGRDIPPPGVTPGSDCNDLDAAVNPDVVWYNDADGDGFGVSSTTQMSCSQPSGYVSNDQDCLDMGPRAAATFPGAAPNDDPIACMTDVDGDDYGSDSPQPGVTPGTDCDDTNAAVPPGC